MPFQLSSGTLAVDVLDPNDDTDMNKMVDPVTTAGLLTQGGQGAAWPPWPGDFIRILPTSRRSCMQPTGSCLPPAPLADRELSPQVIQDLI